MLSELEVFSSEFSSSLTCEMSFSIAADELQLPASKPLPPAPLVVAVEVKCRNEK